MFYIKDLEIEGDQIPIYSTGDLPYLNLFLKDTEEFEDRSGIKAENSFILLTMNNFPYDLEDGVQHWLVWSNRGYQLDSIRSVLRETLHENIEWQLYENAPHLKSIPEISHYQLFIRKRPEENTEDTDL